MPDFDQDSEKTRLIKNQAAAHAILFPTSKRAGN